MGRPARRGHTRLGCPGPTATRVRLRPACAVVASSDRLVAQETRLSLYSLRSCPRQATQQARPAPSQTAVCPPPAPVGSHCALAENLPSMPRSPDHSHGAVGFPRSGRQGRQSWRVKVPLPSIARFGRLACPLLGEVTNRDMRGRKSHGCPWCGNHTKRWERPGWRANPGARACVNLKRVVGARRVPFPARVLASAAAKSRLCRGR
jgi:hypothetical protein